MGKKKTKTSSTQTLAPSTYSQPYIDQSVATVNQGAQQSQDLLKRYLPQAETSLGYYSDVLGGKYLDKGNPYLEGMIQDTNQSIASNVNSQFSGAGRYGSDYHTNALADRIAANENNIRGNQYNTERGYMNQAALGNLAGIQSLVGLPSDVANNQANAINALVGKYITQTGNSTTKQSGGLLGDLMSIGAQLGSAAIMGSDVRLKTNIEKVGEYADGLGIYDYDYLPIEGQIADYMPAGRQRGVMAHEVAQLRPYALGPVIDGFATVDYGAL